jgi:hypothetical protein
MTEPIGGTLQACIYLIETHFVSRARKGCAVVWWSASQLARIFTHDKKFIRSSQCLSSSSFRFVVGRPLRFASQSSCPWSLPRPLLRDHAHKSLHFIETLLGGRMTPRLLVGGRMTPILQTWLSYRLRAPCASTFSSTLSLSTTRSLQPFLLYIIAIIYYMNGQRTKAEGRRPF